MKVFLGGTCNESTWRQRLIKNLKVGYFDPVVDDWTPECMEEELRQRGFCDYVLYVITPFMTGSYAIAEVVDDSNKRPKKTLFCVLDSDVNKATQEKSFTVGQLKSLGAVRKMVEGNGARAFDNLAQVWEFLNTFRKTK